MDVTCRASGLPGNNGYTEDVNGLNIILIDYLRALTDVCKLGILLAGKLDRQLQLKKTSQSACSAAAPRFEPKVDRKQMNNIGSFYTNIMGKMGPLWEQTIFESEENSVSDVGSGGQLSEQSYMRLECISNNLVALHQSMIDSGSSFTNNKLTTSQTAKQLSHKVSPSIVITTAADDVTQNVTASCTTAVTAQMSNIDSIELTKKSPLPQKNSSGAVKLGDNKSHVPTDADMDNIINFLSSTHILEDKSGAESPRSASTHGVTPHATPPGILPHTISSQSIAAKVPLGHQRSAPLPAVAARFLEREGLNPKPLGHHYSDWQLYKPSNPSTRSSSQFGSNDSYGFTAGLMASNLQSYSGSDLSQNSTSPFNSPHLQLPFSKWSNKLGHDPVWSHDSAASSGDESFSNTDQLFNNQTLDLSHLVTNNTRRSSHDSNSSGHALDPGTKKHQSQPHTNLHNKSNIHTSSQPNWSTRSPNHQQQPQNWSPTAVSSTNAIAAATISGGHLGLAVTHDDSIWTPLTNTGMTLSSGFSAVSPPKSSTVNIGAHVPVLSTYGAPLQRM